jgi:threonine dehydratase
MGFGMNPDFRPLRTPSQFLNTSDLGIVAKDETQQSSGAFKYRGAIARLKSAPAGATIYAASTGNHGLAVGLATKAVGTQAVVYVPLGTDSHKLDLIEDSGARIVLSGDTLAESVEAARRDAYKKNGLWLSGFDDSDCVKGYESLFTELFEDAPELDVIFVPVGGGGLLASALQSVPLDVEVWAVQTEASRSLEVSIAARRRIIYQLKQTIAGGLRVPEIGNLAFQAAMLRPPKIVTVSDLEIRKAMRLLWEEQGIKAEPSGAASLAGALRFSEKCRIGCVISGGNITTEQHKSLIAL